MQRDKVIPARGAVNDAASADIPDRLDQSAPSGYDPRAPLRPGNRRNSWRNQGFGKLPAGLAVASCGKTIPKWRPVIARRDRTDLGRRVLAGLILMMAGGSSGCSSLSHYWPTQSGLLSDYSGLKPDPFHMNYGIGFEHNFSRYAAPESVAQIDSYYIESIVWAVDPESRAARDGTRGPVLTARLEQALRDQFLHLGPVVDVPGPRTARVRAVITDARLSRPLCNAAMTAAGVVYPPSWMGPIFFGGACVEAEVLAPDGRQMAAISCASGGGWLDFVGLYIRSNHAKKAMRRSAHELRETLEPQPPQGKPGFFDRHDMIPPTVRRRIGWGPGLRPIEPHPVEYPITGRSGTPAATGPLSAPP
jgi:hypothetical protein